MEKNKPAPEAASSEVVESSEVTQTTEPHGGWLSYKPGPLNLAASPAPADAGERACTCHPDDRPQVCQQKFAASDCQRAAQARK